MEDIVSQVSLKDCPASFLSEWASHARLSKRLHEAAGRNYCGRSDTGLIKVVVLSSAGGLINISLEAVSAGNGDRAVMHYYKVALCCASLAPVAIMSVSTQIGWDSLASTHAEYARHYIKLSRQIRSGRALTRLDDSTFTSVGELINKEQADGARPYR